MPAMMPVSTALTGTEHSPGAGLDLGSRVSRGKTHTHKATPVEGWGWQEHIDHQPWVQA